MVAEHPSSYFQIDGGCAVHVGVAPHPLTPLHLHLTTRNTRVVLKPEGVGSKLATALQTKPRFSGSPPPNQCTRVDHATFREFNSVVCGTPGTQRHERNKCGKERRRPTKPKFRPTIEPRHIHSSTCMYAFNQKASERCASRTSGASALAAESRGRARAVDRGHALPAPLVWHPPCGTPSCSLTRCDEVCSRASSGRATIFGPLHAVWRGAESIFHCGSRARRRTARGGAGGTRTHGRRIMSPLL